jgi:hypothetical protein
MGEACEMYGRRKIGGFMRKSEEEIPLGRPRHRWKNNIKMDLINNTGVCVG